MADILKAVIHTTVGAALGVLVGGVVDGVAYAPPDTKKKLNLYDFVLLSGECGIQFAVNGVVAAGLIKMVEKISGSGLGDPAGGLGFTTALLVCQPKLNKKLEMLGKNVSAAVSQEQHNLMQTFEPNKMHPSAASQHSSAIGRV